MAIIANAEQEASLVTIRAVIADYAATSAGAIMLAAAIVQILNRRKLADMESSIEAADMAELDIIAERLTMMADKVRA